MKRTIAAVIPAFLISFSLLLSACAPSSAMIATLTQLPFIGTPPTFTPYPTFTPRPSGTPTPGPTIFDGVGNGPTSTASTEQPTLDGTVAAALTLAALPTKTSAVTETPPAGETPAVETPVEVTPTAAVIPRCTSITYDRTIPEPNTRENYLGRHYDDRNLPQGMRWVASGMLASDSYSWVHIQVQNQDMYWIEKLVCQDANGQPYWEIADALIIPALNTQAHEVVVDQCFQGEQQIPFAIAYGTYDPSKPAAQVVPNFTGWPLQVNGAWQMKDQFVPLTSQSLTCMLQETQNH